ncbi:MAG: hypothetical protein IPM46_00480 [Flavobacteriales bacterium]|nr:hypothetical protein [Flavobacteriales bacterium]
MARDHDPVTFDLMGLRRYLLLLPLLALSSAFAQQHRLDSLLRVLKTQPEPNAARMKTLIHAAKCWCTIRPENGEAYAREAGRIAERLGDDTARVAAWMNELEALYYLGRYMEADSIHTLAAALADRTGHPRSMGLAGSWLPFSSDPNNPEQKARERSRILRTLDMSRRSGDKALLAENLFRFGIDTRINVNADTLDHALELYRSLGDSMGMAYCIVSRIPRYEPYLGDTEGSLRDLAWATRVLDREGNLVWSNWAHFNRGVLLSQKGQLGPALEELLACLRAGEAMGDPDIAANYNPGRGDL